MQLMINHLAIRIVDTLEANGYEAYVVGGAVRDLLLGLSSTDWDVTTNATPEQMLPLFSESFYDNAFGTVMIAAKHLKTQFGMLDEATADEMIFDITTYRSESEYSDRRRPDNVAWGKTVEEDLQRRDFTVNAIALRIVGEEREIIDPYHGLDDLDKKIIKAVGDPAMRFEEDALRILRAVRIAAQLGFAIEENTLNAIKEKALNLKDISWERIGAETMKLLSTEHSADGILLMANTGILQVVMPEILLTKGVKQAGHHIYDVFTHSIEALRACASPDPVVRLATLLHDVDKPIVAVSQGVRGVTFYNHEVTGARTAKAIAARLRLSKRDCDRVFTLVRWHMFSYTEEMTDAGVRRFIRRVGKENINDMIALRIGDRVGGGSKATSWRLTELQKRIGEQFYEPLSLKDLAVNGADVMRILDITPSKKIGETLNALFEEILDEPSKNNKEYLEKRILELK
ncbi:MAG: CCA tRNA nucleotidyltransferase [bacterium]